MNISKHLSNFIPLPLTNLREKMKIKDRKTKCNIQWGYREASLLPAGLLGRMIAPI